jgi:leishmanolysin
MTPITHALRRHTVVLRRCAFLLCLLMFLAVQTTALLGVELPDETKLPACGHEHVAAEQERMPVTYVSLGKLKAPPTQAGGPAAALAMPPPSRHHNATTPQYKHQIIKMHAAGSAGTIASTWAPIRIAVFTHDLEDDSRYCTAVGQYRPDYTGKSIECTSNDDILTEAKKSVLINYLMPEAVKAHTARLMVHPVEKDSTIVVNSMPGRFCGAFTVPKEHRTTGVSDADFVVYVAAGPTTTPGSFLAWSLTCQYYANEVRHPAVGVIYFNPRHLPESIDVSTKELALYGGDAFGSTDQMRRTAIHELLHALGFTYTVFTARGTFAKVPSLRGKTNVPVLNGTAVRAAAKAHYGFSDEDLFYGVELEDEGASGTTLSHWKRRSTKDELMSAVLNLARYSSLSIAAMEDLGFYKGIYEEAEPLPYGYGAGIDMFNKQCVAAGTSNAPSVFCDSTSSTVHACTTDRLKIGRCYLTYYSSNLPSYAQYFTNKPTFGGALPYMDYCPVIQPLSNANCNSGSQLIIPGSVISGSSRCFDASNVIIKSIYATANAICAQVHCDNTTGTYEVLVSGASSWLSCGTGGAGYSVSPAATSPNVFVEGGTIACPRYEEVCYANPDAFAALPPTTSTLFTTTTTAKPNAASRVAPCAWTWMVLLAMLVGLAFRL